MSNFPECKPGRHVLNLSANEYTMERLSITEPLIIVAEHPVVCECIAYSALMARSRAEFLPPVPVGPQAGKGT